jgi:hypothetical protein
MWLLAFAIYAGCKILTWSMSSRTTPLTRQLGYLLLWPGMDADAFLNSHGAAQTPTTGEWTGAGSKLVLGAGILWAACIVPSVDPYLRGSPRRLQLEDA